MDKQKYQICGIVFEIDLISKKYVIADLFKEPEPYNLYINYHILKCNGEEKADEKIIINDTETTSVELKQEGDSCTPAGLFPISEAFGGEGNPNKNGLKYTLVSNQKNHKWVTKSGDKHYNTLVEDRTGKYGPKECEVLPGNNRAYQKYVIVIDHNTNPVVDGKGSAIFIHKSTREKGTLGCVSVRGTNSDAIMKQLTEWLDPKKEPHIYICVSE